MIGSEELLNERYAKALFESASDQGLAGKVMEELELFNDEWLADKEFRTLLTHPLIDKEEKKNVLLHLARKKHFSEVILHFLNVLIDNKRETLIHAVFATYRGIYEDSKSISRVRVETASPMSKKEEAALVKRLSRAFGHNIHMETKENPGLIGGLRIRHKDKLYDTSMRAGLEMLGEALGG